MPAICAPRSSICRRRPDIDATRIISVGQSAGGFATVALTADPPAGLVAAISFAGGRGSPRDGEVCEEDRLVAAFAAFGKTSRIPMLWVYADNDLFFGPKLAQRMHQAFAGAGGEAELVMHPAFGKDGHALFALGIPLWTPYVDAFLKRRQLVVRDTCCLFHCPTSRCLQVSPRAGARPSPTTGPRGLTRPLRCHQKERSAGAQAAVRSRRHARARWRTAPNAPPTAASSSSTRQRSSPHRDAAQPLALACLVFMAVVT